MPYATGTVNDYASLLQAITDTCTANGWTLQGEVLVKGGCYTHLFLNGTSDELHIRGGTGVDASNNLTGPGYQDYRLARLVFPVVYQIHVHTAPDEVYVIAKCDADAYPWLAFGQSPVDGMAAYGQWAGATFNTSQGLPGTSGFAVSVAPGGKPFQHNDAWQQGAPFWSGYIYASYTARNSTDMNHGLDGVDTWTPAASALAPQLPMVARQPNTWNGEAILLPIEPTINRASNKIARIGSIGHARFVRIDNLLPEDIVTIGSDQWKVYPFLRRNTSVRDGAADADHSGTMGWAIRYDGP